VSDAGRAGRILAALGEGLVELRADGGADGPLAVGFGGDAANACVMAARLGVGARLCGRTGKDALGERMLRFWADCGVDVRRVRRDPAPTGLYLNEQAPEGGHRFAYWRTGSAGSRMAPEDLDDAFLDGAGMLLVTGVSLAISPSAAATATEARRRARERGIPVAFVVNHRPALSPGLGALRAWAADADVLLVSTEDVAAVFGDDELPGGPSELVLSDGARPATVRWAGGVTAQPVPEVAVCDAAGAGDALAGGYLAGRLAGFEPPAALAQGVAAASLSVGAPGCARSYPDAQAVAAAVASLPPSAIARTV
jgi:2-dehydro-3-deoxygluconokinase